MPMRAMESRPLTSWIYGCLWSPHGCPLRGAPIRLPACERLLLSPSHPSSGRSGRGVAPRSSKLRRSGLRPWAAGSLLHLWGPLVSDWDGRSHVATPPSLGELGLQDLYGSSQAGGEWSPAPLPHWGHPDVGRARAAPASHAGAMSRPPPHGQLPAPLCTQGKRPHVLIGTRGRDPSLPDKSVAGTSLGIGQCPGEGWLLIEASVLCSCTAHSCGVCRGPGTATTATSWSSVQRRWPRGTGQQKGHLARCL